MENTDLTAPLIVYMEVSPSAVSTVEDVYQYLLASADRDEEAGRLAGRFEEIVNTYREFS